jgi:hypothetical protein
VSDDRLLHRARKVWRASIERDDRLAAAGRETRLLQMPTRRGGVGGIPAPASVLALAVTAAAAWTPEPVVPRELVDDATADADVEAAPAAEDAPLVVARECFGCARADGRMSPVLPGDRLDAGERVHVPRGSTLVLCWSLESAETTDREVVGPADVRAGEWTAATSARAAEPAPAAVAPVRVDDPAAEWRSAQGALRAGDRSTAERRLHALLAMTSAPASLRNRASFALAELVLARGAVDDARHLLDALARSGDASLAADAVFLEARATSSPRERAELFARYRARRPPSPYREQALVDEAVARADEGDTAAARALVERLHTAAVPDVVVPSLARLERRLGLDPAPVQSPRRSSASSAR